MSKFLSSAYLASALLFLSTAGHAAQGLKLSPIEFKTLANLALLDNRDFIEGKLGGIHTTLFGADFESADAISEKYSENEIAADLKFKNKQLYITGTIESINSDYNDQPFLILGSRSPLSGAQVRFKDAKNQLPMIASLKKGSKINLVCIGAGEMIGRPLLADCITTKQFADDNKMIDTHISLFERYFAGGKINGGDKQKEAYLKNIGLLILTLSNLPKTPSICTPNRLYCPVVELIKLLDGCDMTGKGKCNEKTKLEINETYQKALVKLNNARDKQFKYP